MSDKNIKDLLKKLAGKRSTKKTNSVLTKLQKKTGTTGKRALEAVALVAATRRMDYNRLLRERVKISEFIEKATKDYKSVEEKLKSIEKEELSKTIRNAEKPRWGFFW
jgi:hypothetical protein